MSIEPYEMKFSDEMIEAILSGRKTVTRRPVAKCDRYVAHVDKCREAGEDVIIRVAGTDILLLNERYWRCEDLHDISIGDVISEGIPYDGAPRSDWHLEVRFAERWNEFYRGTEYAWEANPAVLVIGFTVIEEKGVTVEEKNAEISRMRKHDEERQGVISDMSAEIARLKGIIDPVPDSASLSVAAWHGNSEAEYPGDEAVAAAMRREITSWVKWMEQGDDLIGTIHIGLVLSLARSAHGYYLDASEKPKESPVEGKGAVRLIHDWLMARDTVDYPGDEATALAMKMWVDEWARNRSLSQDIVASACMDDLIWLARAVGEP